MPAHKWVAAMLSAKRRVEAALFALIAILLLALVIVIGLQVISRYVLNDAIAWTEESARLLLVWMTFLGAGLLSFRGTHLKLDLFSDKLASAAKKALAAAVTAAVLVFLGVLFVGNLEMIEVRESLPFTSFALSSKYLSYAISAGAVLMSVGAIVSFLLVCFDHSVARGD